MGRIMHGITIEDNLHITYRAKDAKWLRKKYRIGQQILIEEMRADGEKYARPTQRWYTVVAKYPHHLLCQDDSGFRESFNYFDLEKLVVNR